MLVGANIVLYGVRMVPYSVRMVPYGVSLVSSRFCLSVIAGRKSYTAGVTAEEAEELYEGLGCKKLKVIGPFKLTNDDPANYTDKLVFLEQRRDLSGEYPVGADADLYTGFPVMSGKAWAAVSEPATAGTPSSAAAADAATVELKSDLVNWHYQIVKLCQRMGISDACFDVQADQVGEHCAWFVRGRSAV